MSFRYVVEFIRRKNYWINPETEEETKDCQTIIVITSDSEA